MFCGSQVHKSSRKQACIGFMKLLTLVSKYSKIGIRITAESLKANAVIVSGEVTI